MTNDEYIEIYNRFAELPERMKAIVQQREAAEQFANYLNERQADIEPYSAVCAEIEQFCTSGDIGGNDIYDKMQHEIDNLNELTVALEQMNDAEAAISCSDMASIVEDSQRLRGFCSKEIALEQVSDTIERVKKMTDRLKKAFKKEKKKLNRIVDDTKSTIWREEAEQMKKEIAKVSVIDDKFLSELKKSIYNAEKKRQDDINEMLKKHKCLREGGRFYKKHNEVTKRENLSYEKIFQDSDFFEKETIYCRLVEYCVERNKAINGIICSSIGVLLCGVAIFLGFSFWGFEADEFSGLFPIILGSLCLISLIGFSWHWSDPDTEYWFAIIQLICGLLFFPGIGLLCYGIWYILKWIFEFISGLV